MYTLIVLGLGLGFIIWAIGFLKLKLWQFHLLVIAVLFAISILGAISHSSFIWLACLYVILSLPLSVAFIRRKFFSKPTFAWFKKVLPPLSDTEKTAIEAGTVWWDQDLFSGDPDWNKMLAFPKPELTPEEQAFIDGPTEELCRMLDDWQITAELNDLPPKVWKFIKKHRFFAMIVPKEYGGLGFSALANSSVVVKIASRSTTAAVTVMVPNSLGPAELLVHYGTQDQRDYYLPRLASGDEIPCFALTAPSAGSDAGAIPDSGVVCYGEHNGERTLGLRVTWRKRYITLGPIATVVGLAFKAYDPDRILGGEEELGITCALIPSSTPGVKVDDRHVPLNIPFMNGPTTGKDVFVPMDWVIGKENGLGDGWRMLMGCLAAGRAISLPALGAAAGKLCARSVGAYARIRRQFKLPIGKFEGVEEPLARIAGFTYLADAARTMAAGAIDLGEKPTVLSAILKYHNTEAMRTIVNDGMDVLGGKGICLGPKNFLGRVYQSTPVAITVEGANILTRCMIIFGQGAFRCHPYVLDEISAASNPDPKEGLAEFDRALARHIAYTTRNMIRSLLLGAGLARFLSTPQKENSVRSVDRYYQQLSRMSAAFTVLSDVSMLLLGAKLKRMEKLSARLGDCLSYLYYGSAALKHFEDAGRPQEELPLLEWSLQWCLYRIQSAMVALMQNYPQPLIGKLLKMWIFPTGARFRHPCDELGRSVAKILLSNSAVRDRLTAGIYLNQDPDDPTGSIEYAFQLTDAVTPVEQKLRKAANFLYQSELDEPGLQQAVRDGLVTEHEAESLRKAALATAAAIEVDDFPASEFATQRSSSAA